MSASARNVRVPIGIVRESKEGGNLHHNQRKVTKVGGINASGSTLQMNIGAVIRRLGYLMELFEIGSPKSRKPLRKRLTDTVVRLDPLLPAGGKYLNCWRLQLNVTPEELLAKARS